MSDRIATEDYADAALDAAAPLFDAYALLRDERSSGTNAGTLTLGSWLTVPLAEKFDPDGIVSVASNQFTLAAGTYYIKAVATAHQAGNVQTRIRDVTNGVTVAVGADIRTVAADDSHAETLVSGRVVLGASTAFELQERGNQTRNTDGFGVANSFGEVEVYAEVEIMREVNVVGTAFPVDAGRVATAVTSATATPTFNLPSSVQAGDLLVVFWRSAGTLASAGACPTGWTHGGYQTPASADDVQGYIWKWAAGGETSVTMASLGTARNFCSIAWRITGAGGPPDAQVPVNLGIGGKDIPVHDPDGPAQDYLWLAAIGAEDNAYGATGAPSGWTNLLGTNAGSGASGCAVVGASRQQTGDYINPGAFTGGGSSNNPAGMIFAVPPIPPSAIPTVAGVVGSTSTGTATPTFTLPGTANAGDLLIVAWRSATALSTPTAVPSGWTQLMSTGSALDGSGGDMAGCAWKRAVGGETSVTWGNFGSTANFAAIAWRIAGSADPVSTAMTGQTNSRPDNAALDPAGSDDRNLWLVFVSTEDNYAASMTGPPNGFENLTAIGVSSGASGAAVAMASRRLAVRDLNPAPWIAFGVRQMVFTAACRAA